MKILSHPLFLMGISVATFRLSAFLYERSNHAAFLQPILVTSLTIIALLLIMNIPYPVYRDGTNLLRLMLGPAIVALAVPVYQSMCKIRVALVPLLFLLPICTVLVAGAGAMLAHALDLPTSMKFGLLLRSVTAPVSLEIAEQLGEDELLTVLCVIVTGISGAVLAPFAIRALGIKEERAQGFALGLIAHAFGVSRALEISTIAAAFGTIAMVFAACLAAVTMPVIAYLFF